MRGGADRASELVLVFVVATSVIGMCAALAGVFHTEQALIGALLISGFYWERTRARHLGHRLPTKWAHLGLLVLVALMFRVPPFNYVLGGQDEGVYVNISQFIERSGSLSPSDAVLDKLKGSTFEDEYLEVNRFAPQVFLPGVYAAEDPGSSELWFQFYHLFPVWMALFTGAFGSDSGVYALTFLSVLSVVFGHRLVLTVSNDYRAALGTGLLLGANPLLAFFSKFPVTEIPTLCFSFAAFAYLATFWTARARDRSVRALWLSAGALYCLFFTRISGFMYVPFLLLLACVVAVFDSEKDRRTAVQWFTLATLAGYGVSVWYGVKFSPRYVRDIYTYSFGTVFGEHWLVVVVAFLLVSAATWSACVFVGKRAGTMWQVQRLIVEPVRVAVSLAVPFALLLATWKIYQLGWTQHYQDNAWFTRWRLVGAEWATVMASSLFQLVMYAGPLVVLVALPMLCRRNSWAPTEFMRFFTAAFLFYAVVLQWVVPYGPYYARYLASEAVPYVIVFAGLSLALASGRGARRWIAASAFVVSFAYSATLSSLQIGKEENAGLYGALNSFVGPVDQQDLVLLPEAARDSSTAELKTTLLYVLDRNVAHIQPDQLGGFEYLSALDMRFDELFLISRSPRAPGFEYVDALRMVVWAFSWTHLPPNELVQRRSETLYLLKRGAYKLPLGVVQRFQPGTNVMAWLSSGWSDPESWGVWSVGESAELEIPAENLLSTTESGLCLHFVGRMFVTEEYARQELGVWINGKEAESVVGRHPGGEVVFAVNVRPSMVGREVGARIGFVTADSTSPASLGISRDARELGFGLISVEARRALMDDRSSNGCESAPGGGVPPASGGSR